MAARLSYSTNAYRVPVIASIKGEMLLEEALGLVKKNKFHSSQDISCVTIDRSILIFKAVKLKNVHIFEDVRQQLEEYINELGRILKSREATCSLRFYTGNFESSLAQYRTAYEQVRWCKDFVQCVDSGIVFFIDHIEEYLFSRIPQIDLFNLFSTTQALVAKMDKDASLFDTIGAVYDSGMNFQNAAAALGVHRNTVYQRIRHLSDILGFDPIEDSTRSRFIYYLIKGWNPISK